MEISQKFEAAKRSKIKILFRIKANIFSARVRLEKKKEKEKKRGQS